MDAGTNQGRITKDRKRIPDGCLAQHGGILPRRDQFRAVPGPIQSVDPSDRMHYMETYNASEGFFGLQDNPEEHSLLLMIDYSVFYEFIPINEVGEEHPTVLTVRSCRR